MRIFNSVAAMLLIFPAAAMAGSYCDSVKSLVDGTVSVQLKAKDRMPVGLVVGVFSEGHECYYSYGKTSSGSRTAPDKNSIFELGSITKTFNGLLFAARVNAGTLGLQDVAQKMAPEGLQLPAAPDKNGDAAISTGTSPATLEQLLTHFSGLPDFPRLDQVSNIQNPFADFTVAKTTEVLSHTSLDSFPGTMYEYSNLGAGLLGLIIETSAHDNYASLVSREILEPLKMKDTFYTVPGPKAGRALPGYQLKQGFPAAQPWDAGEGIRGALGLRSTPADVMKYLRAHLHPENTPIAAALTRSHAAVASMNFPVCPQKAEAYGWNIAWCEPAHDLDNFYSHAGQTGGFRNFAGFVPNADKAIVVLSNSADTYAIAPGQVPGQEIDLVGGEIMRALLLAPKLPRKK